MLIPLTKKEKLVLEFIRVYSEIHNYSPSLFEIKEHFELKAISTVHEHLNNLKRKGYLTREINQIRSMKVIDTVLAEQQFLEIPVTLALNQNSVLIETTGKLNYVYFHRSQLATEGKYIGIKIETTLYESYGINKEDVIVIQESDHYFEGQEVLACVNEKFYYLGKTSRFNNTKTFAKYDKFQSVVKNFVEKGHLIGLFRDYRSKFGL